MTRRELIELDCLYHLTGGTGRGFREVWIENHCWWIETTDRDDFARKLQAIRILRGEISPVPRLRPDDSAPFDASACLWVRVETRKAAEKLLAFEPKPTLILRDGLTVKRTAFWWLSRELPEPWLKRATERLAHHFGAPRMYADPARFNFAPPGSTVGVQPIGYERMTLDLWHPNQIVGGMKDAPNLEEARRRREEKAARAERIAA